MALAHKLMTAGEFLEWRQHQEGTWELVDGAPQGKFAKPLNMTAGGTRDHAQVAANLIAALAPRLRGGPWAVLGSDLGVRSRRGVRQPDVLVDCTAGAGRDLSTEQPDVIFEVLSPSTRRFDLTRKSDEYWQLPSLQHLVLMEADQPWAQLWSRTEDGWAVAEVYGLDATLRLEAIGVELPLAEAYERVELRPPSPFGPSA